MHSLSAKYQKNFFSQNGEDGIIQECVRRIKNINKKCYEFGGADGYFCSNTRYLINQGWDGIMYDINPSNKDVLKAEITEYNVNDYIKDCGVLSIDIDGNDYAVWEAYKGLADIVIIEINSSIHPEKDHFNKETGCGYKTMVELGVKKGYFLLCHTGNLIFILNKHKNKFKDVFDRGVLEKNLSPIEKWSYYFNTSWLNS